MSGNVQQYALLYPCIDGTILTETQSTSISRNTNLQPIHTVIKGFAGVSPGSGMCEWDVESAVPAGNFEFDAGKKMYTYQPCQLFTLGPGGMTLKGLCYIISDTLTHAVDAPSKYGFKAIGAFTLWS